MSVDAIERGSLDRFLVERAEVVAAQGGAVELATLARRWPWPRGPFPPPSEGEPTEGRLRVEAVGDAILRLRYARDSRIRDGGNHMLDGRVPPPSAGCGSTRGGDVVELLAPHFRAAIHLSPYAIEVFDPDRSSPIVPLGGPDPNYFDVGDSLGTGVHQDRDGTSVATQTFSIRPGHAVYGFGETFRGLDKSGQAIDLWTSDAMGVHTGRVYKPVPFFVSTAGFGVFVHTSARGRCWVGARAAHEVQVAVEDDVLDCFVILGDLARVLERYTELTGRPAVPPAWTFGWWQSRCSYASEEQVLAVVDGDAGGRRPDGCRPPGHVLVPNRLGVRPGVRARPLPRPAWLRPAHGRARRPPLAVADAVPGRGHADPRAARQRRWIRTGRERRIRRRGRALLQGYEGPVHAIDWTNDDAVNVMCDEYARLFTQGASVLKVDFGEELPAEAVYADGTPGALMHNLYPLRYQAAVHEATRRVTASSVAWSRPGWAGAQLYPVHWGGDAPGAWEMMLPQLQGRLSLGLSGFTFWSADIGGTGELPTDRELLIRWLQWGVLLSHARIHGLGDREPFRWPEPARSIARSWIQLRYRLLSYLLWAARVSASAGLPFARPLVLEFQDDPTTWRIGDQSLCGPSILVAPFFEPDGQRRLYVPPGTWRDWWTGSPVIGGRRIEARHPLETMPLFIREGAVVPTGLPMRWVGEQPTDPLRLVIAPYARDGEMTMVLVVDDADVRVQYRAHRGRRDVRITGAPGRVEVDAGEAVTVAVRSDDDGIDADG